jgi:hypothetical protein
VRLWPSKGGHSASEPAMQSSFRLCNFLSRNERRMAASRLPSNNRSKFCTASLTGQFPDGISDQAGQIPRANEVQAPVLVKIIRVFSQIPAFSRDSFPAAALFASRLYPAPAHIFLTKSRPTILMDPANSGMKARAYISVLVSPSDGAADAYCRQCMRPLSSYRRTHPCLSRFFNEDCAELVADDRPGPARFSRHSLFFFLSSPVRRTSLLARP